MNSTTSTFVKAVAASAGIILAAASVAWLLAVSTTTAKRTTAPATGGGEGGQWGPWTSAGPCSTSCGTGEQQWKRQGVCLIHYYNNMRVSHFTSPFRQCKSISGCLGPSSRTAQCHEGRECPQQEHPQTIWGAWTPQGPCSVTCGTSGKVTLSRECLVDGAPAYPASQYCLQGGQFFETSCGEGNPPCPGTYKYCRSRN